MFGTSRPESIRSRVTLDEINGLEISIPAARKVSLMLFLGLWLIGWAFGELAVGGALIMQAFGLAIGPRIHGVENLPFMLFWLCFWTAAGILVMDALVWQFRGRERITIDPNGETL